MNHLPSLSRRKFLKNSALATAAAYAAPRFFNRAGAAANHVSAAIANPFNPPSSNLPYAPGPFAPTWESLSNFSTPDWFRDAKFGIWAHWGPQCQPEQGDWYARRMYMPSDSSHDYDYQVKTYGHPSKFGFKDVINTWKADQWDPEKLLGLYQRAGAKYFCSLANHHDNLDLWNSKYQTWNSVAVGPKKDLVGGWAKAARNAGLRFAVSVHASHAWSWYEVSQFSDKDGPLAGVPYDGKMTKADGKGLWWDGLDPQELYAQSHAPGNGNVQWEWDATQGSTIPDEAYCAKFYNRIKDLIDQHSPDLVYFDDTALPLYPISDVGLRITAHLYNSSIAKSGKLDAIVTGKVLQNELLQKCMVWDYERGSPPDLLPRPWQTDTCIGDWHYKRSIFDAHKYKTAETVARTLVDNVSKNGNLQLNIPLPGSGAPDTDELKFLADFTPWMDVNSPAIYASRPWKIFGEGPSTKNRVAVRAQGFNEGRTSYGAQDFRFMQKDGTLYAFAMGWPADGKYTITALAEGTPNVPGKIERVELLGMTEPLKFTRDPSGLVITLPEQKVGNYAYGLKLSGPGLTV
ncbi:MAG TPA: alpha-L-fucosidase [Opitutales bacterium]|nr:alpha-L-fucosidase [Opitutales bacterium]